MKKLIYNFAMILFASTVSCCTAQKTMAVKCDTKMLTTIEKKINDLKTEDINLFTSAVDQQCKDNVEFSEYHNELLFKVTDLYPAQILKSISNLDNVKKQILLDEFSSGIVDADIQDLKKKIASVKGYDTLKTQIYKALDSNK